MSSKVWKNFTVFDEFHKYLSFDHAHVPGRCGQTKDAIEEEKSDTTTTHRANE